MHVKHGIHPFFSDTQKKSPRLLHIHWIKISQENIFADKVEPSRRSHNDDQEEKERELNVSSDACSDEASHRCDNEASTQYINRLFTHPVMTEIFSVVRAQNLWFQ